MKGMNTKISPLLLFYCMMPGLCCAWTHSAVVTK